MSSQEGLVLRFSDKEEDRQGGRKVRHRLRNSAHEEEPMPIKLYGVLRSRASRNVWLMKELSDSLRLRVPVIQFYRLPDASSPSAPFNTTSPAFRAISPAGHIPVIDDDGFVLSESLAINLYLAKKHGGPLARGCSRRRSHDGVGALRRDRFRAAYPADPLPSSGGARGLARSEGLRGRPPGAGASLRGARQRARRGGGHLVGRRFTVADINAAEVMRYAQPVAELFARRPAVKAWIEACQSRPAFREMMAEREKEPA